MNFMKKIVLIIAALALISCKKEVPADYTVVSGTITNADVTEMTINSMDRYVKELITVESDGTFSDSLKVAPGPYLIIAGRNGIQVYIEHGRDLNITFDAKDLKNTLTFSGTGAPENIYLSKKGKTQQEITGPGTAVYELEEEAYKAKFGEVKTALENLLGSTEGIGDTFMAKEKRALQYAYLNSLNMYERYHAHYVKKPDFKVSEGFLAELEGLDYNNEDDFAYSNDYKQLVNGQYSSKVSEMVEKESMPYEIATLKAYSGIENDVIRNSLMFDTAKFGITYTEDLENFYSLYMEGSTNEDHKKEITKSYNTLLTVSKGKPSPKFVNYENYAGGTTSLDDLKGKFVYVDVWATWCGPCKREIPFLKEIEAQYHGKNIEFVSMSIDKKEDHEKWKAMVAEKELGGIQLFADNDWNSQFVKDYLIKGIPRFILIDPEGNIVTSNAPRPSDKRLVELFDEYNI
jgi:thiol-disulfide isomerase/thioredoxin